MAIARRARPEGGSPKPSGHREWTGRGRYPSLADHARSGYRPHPAPRAVVGALRSSKASAAQPALQSPLTTTLLNARDAVTGGGRDGRRQVQWRPRGGAAATAATYLSRAPAHGSEKPDYLAPPGPAWSSMAGMHSGAAKRAVTVAAAPLPPTSHPRRSAAAAPLRRRQGQDNQPQPPLCADAEDHHN